jgi:hypothetical protein
MNFGLVKGQVGFVCVKYYIDWEVLGKQQSRK